MQSKEFFNHSWEVKKKMKYNSNEMKMKIPQKVFKKYSVTYHHCDNFRICCHILTKACGSVFLRCRVVRNRKNCLHCGKVVRFFHIGFRQTYKVLLGISSSRVTVRFATHEWTSRFSVHIDSAWRVDIGRELEQITWLYFVFMVVKRILK